MRSQQCGGKVNKKIKILKYIYMWEMKTFSGSNNLKTVEKLPVDLIKQKK